MTAPEPEVVSAAEVGPVPAEVLAPVDPKVARLQALEQHVETARAVVLASGHTKGPQFEQKLGNLIVTAVELGTARCEATHPAEG